MEMDNLCEDAMPGVTCLFFKPSIGFCLLHPSTSAPMGLWIEQVLRVQKRYYRYYRQVPATASEDVFLRGSPHWNSLGELSRASLSGLAHGFCISAVSRATGEWLPPQGNRALPALAQPAQTSLVPADKVEMRRLVIRELQQEVKAIFVPFDQGWG
jgi:hypothetical protein